MADRKSCRERELTTDFSSSRVFLAAAELLDVNLIFVMLLTEEGRCIFTCIPCSNQLTSGRSFRHGVVDGSLGSNKPFVMKSLAAQIREMALRASGAYKNCKPCVCLSGSKAGYEDEYPERIQCSYRRAEGDGCSLSRMWGKEMLVRLKGNSSGEITPVSSCRSQSMNCEGENGTTNEWVAHVEPGVLINFVSLLEGGNELKKIRFSRDMFNKWQAQRWWSENYEKVIELYNVQKLNRQTIPLQTPKKSEDEVSVVPFMRGVPMTPPLSKEQLLSSAHHSKGGEDSSSDSLDHCGTQSCEHNNANGLVSAPKLSDISGTRIETSSVDVSARSSSSYETDHSGQLSVSNASDLETEWVEQDEPGVYITVRELPGGVRELRRVRFSREKYGEMHARLWWEENRARIQEQYL